MAEEKVELKPPYLPWTTFVNITDELKGKGLPNELDRTAIQGKSGSTQSHYLGALRFLGLLDGDQPTELFKTYVANPDQRQELMEKILKDKYAEALALGKKSTPQRLTKQFRDYGVDGETGRKAIAFFLNAAKFAGLELSPYWPQTRPGAGGRRGGTTRKKKQKQKPPPTPSESETETPPPPTTDAKDRYIDLLLKKAEDDLDPELLDRIERVIGVEGAAEAASTPEPDGGSENGGGEGYA